MERHVGALRAVVAGPDCQPAVGVFDGFSALVAARAGVSILHASGGAISRSIGYPDVGLVTMSEMLERIREIVEASALPVIADADTGYGNALNAARTARSFAAAGVAALHVEDQVFPKRCGHMAGVEVVGAAEMVDKVKAMRDAVGDAILLVVRTDAVASEGLDRALERTRAYMEAGGDLAFVEGLSSAADVERAARALEAPLVVNQANASTGDVVPLDVLARLGCRIALYPGDIQRAAALSMSRVAEAILSSGTTAPVASTMLTNRERDALFEASGEFADASR